MRIGIFGGTFDPVHFGHLLLAESCREQCRLNEVWFVPALVPPHKRNHGLSSAKDRVAMLELAIAGHDAFRVSAIELDRGGVSYTVDTLESLHAQHADATLFLLMGADSLKDLPGWRNPVRICELAIPIVVVRAGAPSPDFGILGDLVAPSRIAEFQSQQVSMPIVQFSSSEIRQRVSSERSIRFQTPRAVEAYIREHQLYR